jgi:hypothetical protein
MAKQIKVFRIITLLGIVMLLITLVGSCSKDQGAGGNPLTFHTINDYNSQQDTLAFDTVFTSLGSTTKYFTIVNTQSSDLTISSLKLAHLQGKQFRINVNGKQGDNFTNIVVPANDSIYVFVEVTVNPNAANTPIIIQDEVQTITDGKQQKLTLSAWGQNAYYHKGLNITAGTVIWDATKPHIILRSSTVLGLYIKAGATLSLAPGCRVYMGPSTLISVDGTLLAEASNSHDSITFRGIRLESNYLGKPGQWLGLLYSRTALVKCKYVTVDESYFGLADEHVLNLLVRARVTTTDIHNYATAPIPTVSLEQVIIRNSSSFALIALATNLTAKNCLFHSTGANMVVAGLGGSYNFYHCTMANVITNHKSAALTLTQTFNDWDDTRITIAPTIATITNCVVYGSIDSELVLNVPAPNVINFDHCLLKTNVDGFHAVQLNDNGCIFNQDPKFVSASLSNYTPDSSRSPLKDAGAPPGLSSDLYDRPRSDGKPDIGAIEWHP